MLSVYSSAVCLNKAAGFGKLWRRLVWYSSVFPIWVPLANNDDFVVLIDKLTVAAI